ncbi:MAG TPA: porin [Candidatus Acidoferrum sp.]|nr:porin [Candidatus Acidoferrum sp.]
MHRGLVVTAMLALAAGAAWGQSPPPSDQAEQVKALLERVEQLEKRVAELEARGAGPSVTTAAASAPSAAAKPEVQEEAAKPEPSHQMEGHMDRTAIGQLETHYPSLQIRGFGDVDFSATDQKGSTSGFNLGQLDLHLASALSSKISYFGEMTFNAHPTNYTVEVERSIIRYDYNDYFKISFGRYHTPVGYWNTAFHHGAWLETTIDRPEIVRVGGTFIPLHFVGFLVEGNIPSGGAGLGYSVGVGNGRGDTISRPGDAGDNNNNRAWVANVYSRPVKLYGLQFGASVYRDKITLANGTNFREWISSAHVAWTRGAPEFLAEFANVNHHQLFTNVSTNNPGFYVQAAYRLPWLEKSLKPYYRFEYLHTPQNETVFTNLDLVESIFGLRYDISSYAAFKSEYRHASRLPGTPTINGLFLQTSFTF